jgi:hypothetical protein
MRKVMGAKRVALGTREAGDITNPDGELRSKQTKARPGRWRCRGRRGRKT